ncbi:hypothetical protein CK203_017349 [Vitis vinifera]|uniref:Uncharacterized protein n=1 Tax=Vitis vinifera TaxID=29760 RepID=A0A438JZV6_VITVI|nr:hypothetical protein CK203_017349 [Vitis vinifera]
MQRQSLGSPSSKLHIHGGGGGGGGGAKEEILKAEKTLTKAKTTTRPTTNLSSLSDHPLLPRTSSFTSFPSSCSSASFSSTSSLTIHLTPFDGFKKRSSKLTDSNEIADLERFVVKSDVFSIRSLRNLQEIGTYAPKSRLHRKMGDF